MSTTFEFGNIKIAKDPVLGWCFSIRDSDFISIDYDQAGSSTYLEALQEVVKVTPSYIPPTFKEAVARLTTYVETNLKRNIALENAIDESVINNIASVAVCGEIQKRYDFLLSALLIKELRSRIVKSPGTMDEASILGFITSVVKDNLLHLDYRPGEQFDSIIVTTIGIKKEHEGQIASFDLQRIVSRFPFVIDI